MTIRLLTNASTGNGEAKYSDGRSYNFMLWGEFDGATVTLQQSPDEGDTWIDIPMGSGVAAFTDEATLIIDFLGVGTQIRAAITGEGASTSLSAALF